MFELNYQITDNDMKAVNKNLTVPYAILYVCIGIVGLAIGIVGVALKPTTTLKVIGIILIIMSSFLVVCAVLMFILPKNTVDSLVEVGESELDVVVTHENIKLTRGGEPTELNYSDMTYVKKYKNYMLVYFGKTRVLLIKTDALGEEKRKELYEYIYARQGRMKIN